MIELFGKNTIIFHLCFNENSILSVKYFTTNCQTLIDSTKLAPIFHSSNSWQPQLQLQAHYTYNPYRLSFKSYENESKADEKFIFVNLKARKINRENLACCEIFYIKKLFAENYENLVLFVRTQRLSMIFIEFSKKPN
jgi:hypothetical protein